MTIQELQSNAAAAPVWTEACPVEHRLASPAASSPVRRRLSAADAQAWSRTRPPVRSRRPAGSAGQRVLGRPPVSVRACRVEAPSVAGVVDDVPTWVLVGAGILVGVLMLLVLAFAGGPAYA